LPSAAGAPGASRVQISGYGDEKAAVIAQSLGGGGGVGGINISGGIAMDGQLTVGIGGFGVLEDDENTMLMDDEKFPPEYAAVSQEHLKAYNFFCVFNEISIFMNYKIPGNAG